MAPGIRPLAITPGCGHLGHCLVTWSPFILSDSSTAQMISSGSSSRNRTQIPIFGCVASELTKKSWNQSGYVEFVNRLLNAAPSDTISAVRELQLQSRKHNSPVNAMTPQIIGLALTTAAYVRHALSCITGSRNDFTVEIAEWLTV